MCLYTPHHTEYVEERGVYKDVIKSLSNVWYTDADLLTRDLLNDMVPKITIHTSIRITNHYNT